MPVNHVALQPSNNEVTMAHCTEIEATPNCIKLGFGFGLDEEKATNKR